MNQTSTPACPACQAADFELRALRDEGVAAARCVACSAHFLLLDSGDDWFDLIQQGYPRPVRCACKSASFRLSIEYGFHADGEVNAIEVTSICSACGKARRQLSFDVDYAPTDHLLKEPLVPVSNPKVLYDLKALNLLVTLPDIDRIVDLLAGEGTCSFISVVRSGDRWISRSEDAAQVKATLESDFFFIYAMPAEIEIPDPAGLPRKEEDTCWKRSEVIRIGTKYRVCAHSLGGIYYRGDPPTDPGETELGLSLEVGFANEFVDGETIASKSERFRALTKALLDMLSRDFVSWRGPYCFDNPEVNVRIFGDRFQRRAAAKRRT